MVVRQIGQQHVGFDLGRATRTPQFVDRRQIVVGGQGDRVAGMDDVVEKWEPVLRYMKIDDLRGRFQVQQAVSGTQIE